MSETLLSGELVVVDGRRRTLGPGEAVFLGRRTRHSFANESDAPLVAYFFCTPGGLERFFPRRRLRRDAERRRHGR